MGAETYQISKFPCMLLTVFLKINKCLRGGSLLAMFQWSLMYDVYNYAVSLYSYEINIIMIRWYFYCETLKSEVFVFNTHKYHKILRSLDLPDY